MSNETRSYHDSSGKSTSFRPPSPVVLGRHLSEPTLPEVPKPKLLDQVRGKLRLLHYARSTEEAYVHWIRRFILFHNKRHPRDMGAGEINAFLTHLAVAETVSSSTQNQAFSGVLFLYKHVLEIELGKIDALRAKSSRRIPVVMSVDEVRTVWAAIPAESPYRLMVELLYGAGLRLMECCRLRIKDIDFARRQIIVREGKGDKDRPVPLPTRLEQRLGSK